MAIFSVTIIIGFLAITIGTIGLIFAGAILFTTYTLPPPPPPIARKPHSWGLDVKNVAIGDGTAWFCHSSHSQRLTIVVHGHNRSKEWMVPIMQSLAPTSNLLAIDLPAHGSMWPGHCTFGVREADYIQKAIEWAEQQRFDRVLLVGHSMGGSTCLLHQTQSNHPIVDGIATIGSYSSIESVFRAVGARFRLPQILISKLLKISAQIANYDYQQAAPLYQVSKLTIPYLIIHGRSDTLVPPREAKQLLAATHNDSWIVWYNGGHDEPENPSVSQALTKYITILDEHTQNNPTLH